MQLRDAAGFPYFPGVLCSAGCIRYHQSEPDSSCFPRFRNMSRNATQLIRDAHPRLGESPARDPTRALTSTASKDSRNSVTPAMMRRKFSRIPGRP